MKLKKILPYKVRAVYTAGWQPGTRAIVKKSQNSRAAANKS